MVLVKLSGWRTVCPKAQRHFFEYLWIDPYEASNIQDALEYIKMSKILLQEERT